MWSGFFSSHGWWSDLGLVDVTTFTGGAYGLFIPCFCWPKFLPRESFLQKSLKKNSKDILPKIGFLFLQTEPFLNSKVQTRRWIFRQKQKLTTQELLCSKRPVQSLWVRARPRCRHCEASRGQQCYQSPQQRITRFFEFRSHGLVPVRCPAFGPGHRKIHFWIFEARKGAKSSGPNKAAIVFQSSFFRAVELLGGVASKGWLGSSISNFTRLHGIYQVAPENHRFWAVLHPYLLNFTMKSFKKNCSSFSTHSKFKKKHSRPTGLDQSPVRHVSDQISRKI